MLGHHLTLTILIVILHSARAKDGAEEIHPRHIEYWLYTRNTPPDSGGELFTAISSTDLFGHPNFDRSKPCVFVVHGWKGYDQDHSDIIDALLERGDYSVFLVKWKYSLTLNYLAVTDKVYMIGEELGSMINRFTTNYVDFKSVTIIGYGEGAHIAGIAGQLLAQKVARLVGVDPTRINFQHEPADRKLSRNSAEFVEVVHTSASTFGTMIPLGHADFYVNGGKYQPNCTNSSEDALEEAECNHHRAWEIVIEALLSQELEGIYCGSYEHFKKSTCWLDEPYRSNRYYNLGQDLPWRPFNFVTRGSYYLQTNGEAPFGLGREGAEFTRPGDPRDEANYTEMERLNDNMIFLTSLL